MIDAARQKRILALVASHRDEDRAQGLELLRAVDEPELWTAALSGFSSPSAGQGRRLQLRDLPLLAAAPADLPVAAALVSSLRTWGFYEAVPPEAPLLSALATVSVTVVSGGDPPRVEPTLSTLQAIPALRALELRGADLGDGRQLPVGLRTLELTNCVFDALPAIPALEVLTLRGKPQPRVIGLGPDLPSARRVSLDVAPSFSSLAALARAARLEELVVDGPMAVADLAPLAQAIAAGAPLRRCVLTGAPEIRSLDAFSGAPLEELRVTGCAVDALAPVRSLPLRHLSLGSSRLTALAPLAGHPTLRALDLRGCTDLADLSPLLDLPALRVIALAGTRATPTGIPAVLRPYATWAEEPLFDALAERPRHPGDPR